MGAPLQDGHRLPRVRPHARGVGALLAGLVAALAVAACGSSGSGGSASSNPQTLLKQAFSHSHAVRSGVLSVGLVITPQGSSVISTPLSLSLSGPFQSRGRGRTPESALTIALSGLGHHASFGVRTTASAAYVTLQGVNYQLPAADFAKLRSTLGSGGSSSGTPGLSSLGVDPRTWLTDPKIVGTQTIGGVATEHLHASVDVGAFLRSINTVLARDASTLKNTTGHTESISPSLADRIAADVRSPTVDLYIGRSDATLRRMQIAATVPVSGALSTRLGGLRSATFSLTFAYSELNRPQTIAAPADVHSDAQLQAALRSIGARLESELGGGVSSQTGSGSASEGSGAAAGKVSRYSSCINRAGGDVRRMRRCAALLQNG